MPSNSAQINSISVAQILDKAPEQMNLEVISGSSKLNENHINSERIQKLGLAFAGYSNYLHQGRVMMIGQSEIEYLAQLEVKAKNRAIDNLQTEKIKCVLVSKKLELPPRLLKRFNEFTIPVIRTNLVSSLAISHLSRFLQNHLAPRTTIHGVMLGMYNLGVLILGDSGIGKSECALDLIRLGHQLISDDSVVIKKIGDILEASSPGLTFEHIEIRGLGILNIKELYGITAIEKKSRIELCIELKKWNKFSNFDRLGLQMQNEEIFGIDVPKFVLPVSSGRNITTLVETAVRLHLLKKYGRKANKDIIEKHNLAVKNN